SDAVPPRSTLTAPADGGAYFLNAAVASSYGCSDPGGSGVATCVGPGASGSNFNTSSVGPKSFTVNATDVAGNAAVKTNNYNVEYKITISPLKTPANQGSAVPITWLLQDGLNNVLSDLSDLVKMESVYNGAAPAAGCVA